MVPTAVPTALPRSARSPASGRKPNAKPHLHEIIQHWGQKPSLAAASSEVLPLRNGKIGYSCLQTSAQKLTVSLGSCKPLGINTALTTGRGEATKKV